MALIIFNILMSCLLLVTLFSMYRMHQLTKRYRIDSLKLAALEATAEQSEKDVESLKDRIRDCVETAAKLIKLVNQHHNSVKKHIKLYRQDMSGLLDQVEGIIREVDKIGHAQVESARAHNDLAGFIIDEISKVWCDLCEDDCNSCPFEENCKSQRPDVVTSASPGPYCNNYDTRGITGSMTIDSRKPEESLKALEEAMQKSGLPQVVINQYLASLKEHLAHAPHPDEFGVAWKVIGLPEDPNCPNIVCNNKPGDLRTPEYKQERIIDPKSKIVKTLNNLFNKNN